MKLNEQNEIIKFERLSADERIRDLINRRMIDHDHLADSKENKYGKEFALKQLSLEKMPIYIKENQDKYKEYLDLD